MRPKRKKSTLSLGVASVMILALLIGCQDNLVDQNAGVLAKENAADGIEEFDELEDLDAEWAALGKGMAKIPFADAEIFFEFNSTDNDLGLQVALDAVGWRNARVRDATSNTDIVHFKARGPLADLGITELRFESAEPSPAEVLALFNEGEYWFRGRTVDGQLLFSTAELSKDLLPPATLSISDGDVIDPSVPLTVTWDAPGADIVEIIFESEDGAENMSIELSGEETSLDVPSQLLVPDAEYKVEILSIGENGNKTIVERVFTTSS